MPLFFFFPPGAQYLPVVLTWLWLWVITSWHWITQINSFSNQSCQGLLSKSDVTISSFSALLFAGELKLPMSVAACPFCIWGKELLGVLLFLLKLWLNVHWHAGTWVPSFVCEFHVIQNWLLLLLLFVNLQLQFPFSAGLSGLCPGSPWAAPTCAGTAQGTGVSS